MMLFIYSLAAQDLLDLEVKDLDGTVSTLRDRIDPSSNYIIETMAFWCQPCLRSMDDFHYHQAYWKERYNTEIILLEDEHYNDIPFVDNEMLEGNWDLDIYLTDDAFSDLGINSFPTYFFVEANSDSIYEIPSGNERFLLEKVDSVFFDPIFQSDFHQATLVGSCESVSEMYFSATSMNVIVDDKVYYRYDDIFLRERELNGDLMILDMETNEERAYIKYSAPLCSRQTLIDAEGDQLEYKVLDKYQVDGVLHVLTDQLLFDDCTGDAAPFVFVQDIGSNGGLKFDIADGKVNSRLVCHKNESSQIYLDSLLEDNCLFVDVDDTGIDASIQVFPNPTYHDLNIILDETGERKIELWTISGRKLYEEKSNKNSIRISNLNDFSESNMLILKISTNDYHHVEKIVLLDPIK